MCAVRTMNGVGIVVNRKIGNARKIVDKILDIKLLLEKEIMHIISVYTLKVGLNKTTRIQYEIH